MAVVSISASQGPQVLQVHDSSPPNLVVTLLFRSQWVPVEHRNQCLAVRQSGCLPTNGRMCTGSLVRPRRSKSHASDSKPLPDLKDNVLIVVSKREAYAAHEAWSTVNVPAGVLGDPKTPFAIEESGKPVEKLLVVAHPVRALGGNGSRLSSPRLVWAA